MKRTLLTLTTLLILFFGACKKDNSNTPGGNTGNDTYQPLSAGSTWKYRTTTVSPIPGDNTETLDTTENTMTAEIKKIGTKNYHVLKSVDNDGTTKTYLNFEDHVYSTIQLDDESDKQFDLPYLNDNVAAGTSWTTGLDLSDAENQIDARLKTTIAEKGISRVILGKSYTNLIHSNVELQVKINGTYTTQFTQEFYVAKGIGVVAIYANTGGKVILKSEIFSYKIK
jgi:hypothetical protein